MELGLLFTAMKARISFIMVGTLEPRKGYGQVLDAFQQLWRRNVEVNLVVVGKEGWLVDDLSKRFRAHSKKNQRFFWIEGACDEDLEKIYNAGTALITASFGEGFGLPIVEAAKRGLPIIARDTPINREVAQDSAYFFNGSDPIALERALEDWLKLYEKDAHPKPDSIRSFTWKESSQTLLNLCIKHDHSHSCEATKVNHGRAPVRDLKAESAEHT